MTKARSARRFKALFRTAVAAKRREEYRLAADSFLEAFEAAPLQFAGYRSKSLLGWVNALNALTSSSFLRDDDVQMLERISKDTSELLYKRAFALKARAEMHLRHKNFTKAATLFRRILAFADEVDAQERVSEDDNVWKANDWVQHILDSAKKELGVLSTKSTVDSMMQREHNVTEDEMLHRMSTAGFECECCGKTPEDLGADALFKCSRCRLAFYCSKACQAEQWKAGHNDACRRYGEVSIGDWMLIHSCKNRRNLNGKPVIVRWPVPRTEGRWHVEDLGKKSAVLSIASKNLRHMRPLH